MLGFGKSRAGWWSWRELLLKKQHYKLYSDSFSSAKQRVCAWTSESPIWLYPDLPFEFWCAAAEKGLSSSCLTPAAFCPSITRRKIESKRKLITPFPCSLADSISRCFSLIVQYLFWLFFPLRCPRDPHSSSTSHWAKRSWSVY